MTLDGLQLAVLTSRMEQVVRAMANTLARTARSGVINTARDFSCCVLTGGDAQLVATAESLPVHVMRGPDIMAAYTAQMHPDLRRGDAYLHNSPYHATRTRPTTAFSCPSWTPPPGRTASPCW